jgi:hypothetical protein
MREDLKKRKQQAKKGGEGVVFEIAGLTPELQKMASEEIQPPKQPQDHFKA